jgi:hypothetical protein
MVLGLDGDGFLGDVLDGMVASVITVRGPGFHDEDV